LASLAAAATRLPLVPAQAQCLNAFRVPMVMSTAKTRRDLRWRPRHTATETLAATVAAARTRGIL
jgi:UDP-glucose 4-epimerase